jgi:hypothetical protein
MPDHLNLGCCTWDPDGNPEVCLGPAREEPYCPPCGDSGIEERRSLWAWWRPRPCRWCSPTRLDRLRTTVSSKWRRGAASSDDEPPF